MIRIGIVGVPGSGKTSLCRGVVSACRGISALSRIELVSEYARRYISKHGHIESIWEQYRIMEKQIEWEDSIPSGKTDILITDSPIHMGFLYATEVLTNKPKDIMVYNDIFKKLSKLSEHRPRYNIIFHLTPVLNPIDDGVRAKEHLDPLWRADADRHIKFIFELLFKPKHIYVIDNVNMEYRINFIIETLKDTI